MKATAMSGQNGAVPARPTAEQAQRAAHVEQRRREVSAAYLSLPDALLDNFERLAMAQPPHAQLGSLMLVVAIRWRRAKERARVEA